MSRARRTRILARSKTGLVGVLASVIENRYEIEELISPQTALVMIKKRDGAKGVLFYLGEMLVTEAKVRINGAVGVGIAQGYADEIARKLAVVDAAFNSGLPETLEWMPLLESEEKAIAAADAAEARRVARTRVVFEGMDTEMPR